MPFHRMVASAIEGDREALTSVLKDERLDEGVGYHRMGAALFVAAKELGLEGPAVDRCHAICVATAVQWMGLRAALAKAGEALDAADVPWVPLKGLDTAERFFPRPELRLSSDIDVIVPVGRLDDAMRALSAAGWVFNSTPLERTPMMLDFHYFQSPQNVVLSDLSESKKFGTEVDFTLRHVYTENITFTLGASWFGPGDVFKDKRGSDSSTWFYAMTMFKI